MACGQVGQVALEGLGDLGGPAQAGLASSCLPVNSCAAACAVRGGWPWLGRRGPLVTPWPANFDLDDLVDQAVDLAVDRDASDASYFGAYWACLACVGSWDPYFLEVHPFAVGLACLDYLVQDSFQESEIAYFVASSVSRDFDHLEF